MFLIIFFCKWSPSGKNREYSCSLWKAQLRIEFVEFESNVLLCQIFCCTKSSAWNKQYNKHAIKVVNTLQLILCGRNITRTNWRIIDILRWHLLIFYTVTQIYIAWAGLSLAWHRSTDAFKGGFQSLFSF